jgi:hypothetical protein
MASITKGRGNSFAHLEDVYNRKETVREEQAAAYQAKLEAQFVSLREQIKSFTKQLSIKGGQERHRHIPSPRGSKEEDEQGMEDEDGNPFVKRGVHRRQPLVQAHANRWEFGFKLDIPKFNGRL